MSAPPFDRALFCKLRADAKDRIRADGRLTPAARAIGAEIIDQVHTERRYAWCSETWLADKLKLKDRKTVQRAVKQLCETGWLYRWRLGRSNRYVPAWLNALDDPLSRQVLAAAKASDRIGDKLSPIESGKGTFSSAIGDKNHPRIGDKNHPLSLSLIPISIPGLSTGATSAAPAAAGDLTAAATGASETPQRELPLLRSFGGARAPLRRDAENAAEERLTTGMIAALGEGYGDFVAWASPELDERALGAELGKPGAGVAMLVEAWSKRAEGAGRQPTHDELVHVYLEALEEPAPEDAAPPVPAKRSA